MCNITSDNAVTVGDATVVRNESVCREHYRLVLSMPTFPPSLPGQFVHIKPEAPGPMLRRAFSIAGRRRCGGADEITLIYRVVGRGTTVLAKACEGDSVSVLGPLGNAFPIPADRGGAILIGGGVGLPPMIYLADALAAAGKKQVAFCGSASADLLALTVRTDVGPDVTAASASMCAEEFAASGTPVVISTDDGSAGYKGYVGDAFAAYLDANELDPADTVIYTCGPEPMMASVARISQRRSMPCYVCMERAMGCGIGTCQSCVVRVTDDADPDGWRYRLCCTDGPVFPASKIIW